MPVEGIIVLCVIAAAVLAVVVLSFTVVKQSTSVVVERMGKYYRTLETGWYFIIPFIDKKNAPISLKEKVADFPPQPVITKDNVTMQIDTVVYFQITDPKLFTYGVERPMNAIENLTATTLRNVIGELELDETLTSRDTVNDKMRIILDEATDPWGIKINRVELKNILPPRDIQEAMEKQMRAERERRESILRAEGEKRSNILVAEGEKEAALLRADAKKATLIAEAEGNATAIKMINEACPNAAYVTLQGYEALKSMANGQATKIIVPSEIQNVAGLFASVSEVIKKDEAISSQKVIETASKPKATNNAKETSKK